MKVLSNLAYLKAICGEASSAKEDIQKVLEFYISSTGENSIYVGETYNEMCIIYEKIGDYSASCMYGEKAIEIFTELLGADHSKTKLVYENLAFACKSPRRQQ